MLHKGDLPFTPTSPLPGASTSPPPFRNDARASWRASALERSRGPLPLRAGAPCPRATTFAHDTGRYFPSYFILTHAVPFGGLAAELVDRRPTHQSARRGGQAKRTSEAAQHPAARDPASRHHPNAEGQPRMVGFRRSRLPAGCPARLPARRPSVKGATR